MLGHLSHNMNRSKFLKKPVAFLMMFTMIITMITQFALPVKAADYPLNDEGWMNRNSTSVSSPVSPNPLTDMLRYIGRGGVGDIGGPIPGNAGADGYWFTDVVYDDKGFMWFFAADTPSDTSTNIVKMDIWTGACTEIPFSPGNNLYMANVMDKNGIIWMIPSQADLVGKPVYKLDTNTNTLTASATAKFPAGASYNPTAPRQVARAVLDTEGTIWITRMHSNDLWRLDTTAETLEKYSLGADATMGYTAGLLMPNGKIWFAPSDSISEVTPPIEELDIATRIITPIGLAWPAEPAYPHTGDGYSSFIDDGKGFGWLLPETLSEEVIKVNLATKAVIVVPWDPALNRPEGQDLYTERNIMRSATFDGRYIWALISTLGNVIRIDTETGSMLPLPESKMQTEVPGSGGYRTGISLGPSFSNMVFDGRSVWLAANNSTRIVQLVPDVAVNLKVIPQDTTDPGLGKPPVSAPDTVKIEATAINPQMFKDVVVGKIKKLEWFRTTTNDTYEFGSTQPFTAALPDSFDTKYGLVAAADKGEILAPDAVVSEHVYTFDANKNGRYWVKISFEDNAGNPLVAIQDAFVKNMYTKGVISISGHQQGNPSNVLYAPEPYRDYVNNKEVYYGVATELNDPSKFLSSTNGTDVSYNQAAPTTLEVIAKPVPGWLPVAPGKVSFPINDTTPKTQAFQYTKDAAAWMKISYLLKDSLGATVPGSLPQEEVLKSSPYTKLRTALPTVANHSLVGYKINGGATVPLGPTDDLTFTTGTADTVVTLVYEPNAGGAVTVKYQDFDTSATIATDVVLNGAIGATYTAIANPITNYTYDSAVGSLSGTFTTSAQTVILKYKKNAGAAVTVKYQDFDTAATIAPDVVLNGTIGATYTAIANPITNYTYDSAVGSLTGTFTTSTQTVILKYKKNAGGAVTVKYQDFDTAATIAPDVVLNGAVGAAYAAVANPITNYTYNSAVGSLTGTFTASTQTVILKYKKNAGGAVTVKYQDFDTAATIAPDVVLNGTVGATYTAVANPITDYGYDSAVGSLTGTFTASPQTVILKYKKSLFKVAGSMVTWDGYNAGNIKPGHVTVYNASNAVVAEMDTTNNALNGSSVMEGKFEFNLPAGTYYVIATKKNHTTARYNNLVVSSAPVTISNEFKVYAGDFHQSATGNPQDNIINALDRSWLLSNYELTGAAADPSDLNDDSELNGLDRSLLMSNYDLLSTVIN